MPTVKSRLAKLFKAAAEIPTPPVPRLEAVAIEKLCRKYPEHQQAAQKWADAVRTGSKADADDAYFELTGPLLQRYFADGQVDVRLLDVALDAMRLNLGVSARFEKLSPEERERRIEDLVRKLGWSYVTVDQKPARKTRPAGRGISGEAGTGESLPEWRAVGP